MQIIDPKKISVAVGVLTKDQQFLVSQRPNHVHQGGLWEFPGGKVEAEEATFDALRREFLEELGVTIEDASPLLDITHTYPDKTVCLKVYLIHHYRGDPQGLEGQTVRWVNFSELKTLEFPAANQAIIDALDDAAHQMK